PVRREAHAEDVPMGALELETRSCRGPIQEPDQTLGIQLCEYSPVCGNGPDVSRIACRTENLPASRQVPDARPFEEQFAVARNRQVRPLGRAARPQLADPLAGCHISDPHPLTVPAPCGQSLAVRKKRPSTR